MNIDLNSRALLSLIAKTSFGKNVDYLQDGESIDKIDWEAVYKESVQQTVILFASGAVSDYKDYIPENIYGKWLVHSAKVIKNNMAVMNCQNELVSFLNEKQYKYIILKGLASSYYYENPEMRMLGDVDFLVENEKSDEISNKLQNELGFARHTDFEHICHITLRRGRDVIEMHFEIPGIPNGKNGEYVRDYIRNILDDTNVAEVDKNSFSAPSHLYHGVIILLHMLHHMATEGLGLRHLCDWGAFVNKTYAMDFWKNDFVPFLKKIGLLRYASVMTSVCSKYMGIDMPDSLPIAEDSVCEEIICDILKSGNFGNKDEQYHQSGLIVSRNGKDGVKKSTFSVMLSTLDSAVKLHWPWLKKWKIFLPFAYVIFTIRYYMKVIAGKRPSLSSLVPEANERKRLYKKLEIYEDEK